MPACLMPLLRSGIIRPVDLKNPPSAWSSSASDYCNSRITPLTYGHIVTTDFYVEPKSLGRHVEVHIPRLPFDPPTHFREDPMHKRYIALVVGTSFVLSTPWCTSIYAQVPSGGLPLPPQRPQPPSLPPTPAPPPLAPHAPSSP